MASIFPFRPYRYSATAGPLETLLTQPYDKISPAMRARYLALSPHNLVRIILGESRPDDNASDNVYTRAAEYLNTWIASGVLERDKEASLFAYFQEFSLPDSGEILVRKGFIGLGAVQEYSAGVVHRHEQTLTGPKKDRLELLRHTRAHFGQIFMLYDDRERVIDGLLDAVSRAAPDAVVTDEYQTTHRLWKISQPDLIEQIQQRMQREKLLIADGHHRYETALAFRKEHPELADAGSVMMTFVNMSSPGLTILATHRLVSGLADFNAASFLKRLESHFEVRRLASVSQLRDEWTKPHADRVRIGVVFQNLDGIHLVETARRKGRIDVSVLHEDLLAKALEVSEEAVREEKFLRYIRGVDQAVEQVKSGAAQIAFLLEPASIEEVAGISFSGGVMPQKSTDFYPKLLTGLTIYKLDS